MTALAERVSPKPSWRKGFRQFRPPWGIERNVSPLSPAWTFRPTCRVAVFASLARKITRDSKHDWIHKQCWAICVIARDLLMRSGLCRTFHMYAPSLHMFAPSLQMYAPSQHRQCVVCTVTTDVFTVTPNACTVTGMYAPSLSMYAPSLLHLHLRFSLAVPTAYLTQVCTSRPTRMQIED